MRRQKPGPKRKKGDESGNFLAMVKLAMPERLRNALLPDRPWC